MTWNGQFHLIRNFSNLFPPKWLRMTQNGQFCLIRKFSNLFPPKWLRMTQNGQLCLIRNFSNLFAPKWLRMTWNGQFCMAKIKYTLIQGNFYERLLFYMDSCALSPMASLLTLCALTHELLRLNINVVYFPKYQTSSTSHGNFNLISKFNIIIITYARKEKYHFSSTDPSFSTGMNITNSFEFSGDGVFGSVYAGKCESAPVPTPLYGVSYYYLPEYMQVSCAVRLS